MEVKISKLIKLCQNRHKSEDGLSEFQDYVEEMSYDEMETIIRARIGLTDGPQIVNAVLNGLTQKSSSHKKRLKIFELLVSLIQTEEIPVRNVSTITAWLVMELEKFTITHLLRISDICVNYVSTSTEANHTSWKDLLPKILSIVTSKNEIDHYGSVKTGEEFKQQVILALIQAKWETRVLSSLAAMFIHIPMTVDEHSQVVSKLCERFSELEPAELPPLVHQLLLLTKHQHTMTLFFSLRNYYDKFVYRFDESLNMQDSTQLESPDAIVSTKKKDILENQSVVLYHIEDCAKRSLGCTTELLKTAKNSINCPEVFLEPFLLSVLLSLSTIPMYETQIMDIVKATIVRSVLEDEKKIESHWLRDLLDSTFDVDQVLVKLIRSSMCDQDTVISGLVSLSMVLLRHSGGIGANKVVCRRVWTLGRMIAVNIVKKHHQVSGRVLSSVTDAIFNRPDVSQYTDCLAELCDTSPLLVVDSSGTISRLLEALPELPAKTAHKVISAIISLSRVSLKLRDNLILVLRKSLFMHDEGTRKMAVFGFLQLLKRLKLRGLSTMSQNSFQIYTCPSILTQTCLDVHSTGNVYNSSCGNEGICLEVINILKRCFMQQASVKITLYQGVNRALIRNPELCCSIASVFMEHLADFYENDPDVLPPLKFSKAVQSRGSDAIVIEPLGDFLYALHQVVVVARSMPYQDDEEFSSNYEKLQEIFDMLVKRFALCDLKHFELDVDDMDAMKEEILKEVLTVYQSLLLYLLSIWNASVDVEFSRSYLSLYRSYHTFETFAKGLKEVDIKKRGRSGASSQATQAKRTSTFIFPRTIFDFESVHRLLSLLLCDSVDWSMEDVAAEIKSKKPQYKFAMQICLEVVMKAKSYLSEYRAKSVLDDASKIARLIFDQCLNRFEEIMDFNAEVAAGAVECFTEICSLVINNFNRHLSKFLQTVCDEDSSLNLLLEKVVKIILKNLGKVLESEEDSADLKKLTSVLISCAYLLCQELPPQEPCVNKVIKWLTEAVRQKELSPALNAKTIISLLLSLLMKSKKDSNLQDNIALRLCELFGSINDVDVEKSSMDLKMINEENMGLMMTALCSSLSSRLDSVDWTIVRLKASVPLLGISQSSGDVSPKTKKCELKKREKDLVQEVALVVSCCQWVCAAAVSGTLSETVSRLLLRTYSVLTSLTKYFTMRASQHNPVYQEARFGKLVRLSGSQLSSQVADFILYIEAIDENESEKKLSKKVLNQAKKQTIYIPKLVAELENFTKCVTQLSNKCKDSNLSTNMKLTTTRDFRLNTKKLEEVLKRNRESDEETDNNDTTVTSNGGTSQSSQKSTKKNNSLINTRKKLKK